MKKLLTLLLAAFLLASFYSAAQNETNHWRFGYLAGLDFSTGTPLPEPGIFDAVEGTSAISDPVTGNLLLYTGGSTVYDATDTPMPNGTGLVGCGSSTQSSIIVPQPGSTTLFYIFTVDCIENLGMRGYNYTVVDMALNGGLGDVDTTQKNVFLSGPSGEEISAVKHANCVDWWIMTKERGFDVYHAYLLTETGVSGPVTSTIGMDTWDTRGQAKFSPDGSKYAIASYSGALTQLFDFDNATGLLSNPITLALSENGCSWGVSFSSDNSKLYTTRGLESTAQELYQYDLSSGSPAAILASCTLIGDVGFLPELQMGKDLKIYISNFSTPNLSVIQTPNALGMACGFEFGSIPILATPGTFCYIGLCNFPDSFFSPPCPAPPEELPEVPFTPEIPNVITPNGDGLNDAFNIDNLPPASGLWILNRWGNLIFTSDSYSNDWAGNQSDGVYFYILKLPGGKTFHGFVEVIAE